MRTIFILSFTVVVAAMALDLPSSFKICKRSQPKMKECLKDAIKQAIISMAGGLKSFKIMPIEPLALNNLTINPHTSGPVTLNQQYENTKVHGFTKGLQIIDCNWDWDNLIYSIQFFNPEIVFAADSVVKGKILILPIDLHGFLKVYMYNMTWMHDIYHETYEKNGEVYLRVKKHSVKLFPQHVMADFKGVAGRNNIIDMEILKFVNMNGDLIFREIRLPFEELYGKTFATIGNNILTHVPMNKMYPPT